MSNFNKTCYNFFIDIPNIIFNKKGLFIVGCIGIGFGMYITIKMIRKYIYKCNEINKLKLQNKILNEKIRKLNDKLMLKENELKSFFIHDNISSSNVLNTKITSNKMDDSLMNSSDNFGNKGMIDESSIISYLNTSNVNDINDVDTLKNMVKTLQNELQYTNNEALNESKVMVCLNRENIPQIYSKYMYDSFLY